MSRELVVFFSVSGVTKKVASFRCGFAWNRAEKPYSQENLDWTNENNRSTIEMKKDKFIRPAIANKVLMYIIWHHMSFHYFYSFPLA